MFQPFILEKVSPELWAEIFLFYAIAIQEGKSYNYRKPIWILGHVCQLWRQIALSTPRLWNNLRKSHSLANQRMSNEELQELLVRSRRAPLYFTHLEGDLQETWPLMVQHSERWYDVNILGWSLRLEARFQALKNVPRLFAIKLTMPSSPNPNFMFLNRALELRRVQFAINDDKWSWSTIQHIPWSQIECYTEFHNTQKAKPACNVVLPAAPNLQSLRFIGPMFPFPNLRFTHSQLRQLALYFLNQQTVQPLMTFFDRISLPALKKFVLQADHVRLGKSTILPTLCSFIMRSKCSLEELTIHNGTFPLCSTEVAQLLECTPNLKRLALGNCITETNADHTLASVFVCKEKKTILVPHLVSMSLTYNGNRHGPKLSDILEFKEAISPRSQLASNSGLGHFRSHSFPTLSLNLLGYGAQGLRYISVLEGFDLNLHLEKMLNLASGLENAYYKEAKATRIIECIVQAFMDIVQHMKADYRYVFAAFDAFSAGCKHKFMKGEVWRLLEEHKIISCLDSFLHHRNWMFAGNNIVYIPPYHKLRSSKYRWDLILGAPDTWISYLMDEEEFPPGSRDGRGGSDYSDILPS